MRVGAHQPNFFPHERLLQRIAACDRFILLGHAQFEKGGYINRFRHQDRWYTMAVNRGLEPILFKHYVTHAEDWATIRRRLPEYDLAPFDADVCDRVAGTNLAVLRRCCAKLGITTELVMDYPTDLRGTARLVDLCQFYGASVYLSGPSGAHYLDPAAFPAATIHLEIQPGGPTRSCLEALHAPV